MGVTWAYFERAAEDFIERYELSFPTINDPSAELFVHFGVAATPAFLVISHDGESERIDRLNSADDLDDAIDRALDSHDTGRS